MSSEPAADDGGRLRAAVVVLAAGEGRRAGQGTNKVLLPLAGQPVFVWSVRRAQELPEVHRTVLVVRDEDRDVVTAALDEAGLDGVELVAGGETRHGSEWNALQVLAPAIDAHDLDVVVIHDAARPLAPAALWTRVLRAAAEHGGAIPGVDAGPLATRHGDDPPSGQVVAVQTPQAFAGRAVLAAYRRADGDGFVGTDTASCTERYATTVVHRVEGDARNVKITFPDDFALAERLLERVGASRAG